MSRPLVILERDGVINLALEGFLLEPDDWEPVPGSAEAIARLHHAGFAVAVATNQVALSRGLLDMSMINAIHQRMTRTIEAAGGRIDAIAICPHDLQGNCTCRKPRPGMLNELIERFDAAREHTVAIGDTRADLEAGLAAGVASWLVHSNRTDPSLAAGALAEGVELFDDLAAAAQRLLDAGSRPRTRERARERN